ncbi:Rsp [Neisseria gonorrhoeae]|uniref:Rsp n=1 Tax=Neisseria gonorrhoeae TaxID=485 RepID=A0A378VWL9_NEIGO|nr:Rsp [Neisseria gonorrhoeae]
MNQIVLNRVQEAVVVINVEHQTILFNKRQKICSPCLKSDSIPPCSTLSPSYGINILTHLRTPYRHARTDRPHPRRADEQKQNKLLILYIRPQSEIQAEALSVNLPRSDN